MTFNIFPTKAFYLDSCLQRCKVHLPTEITFENLCLEWQPGLRDAIDLQSLISSMICHSKQIKALHVLLQPGFDEINPEWRNSLEKRKKIKGTLC